MLFTREENLTKKNQRFLNILILSIPILILTSCGTNSETSNIDLPELKKVDFNGSLPDKNKTCLKERKKEEREEEDRKDASEIELPAKRTSAKFARAKPRPQRSWGASEFIRSSGAGYGAEPHRKR